jgi:hypothetical protein
VFENRVSRRIFGPRRDEVTGEWSKLHSGELHNLYSSPDIIRQIKSRKMRWAGHVERMGQGRNVYRVLVGKPEGKDHLKDEGVDGRMGSKWTWGRLVGGCEVDSPGSGWGSLVGCCCGDEPSGSGATELVVTTTTATTTKTSTVYVTARENAALCICPAFRLSNVSEQGTLQRVTKYSFYSRLPALF